ncbi:acyl-CoA N-acyltransferase [Rhizodiscina lignyota]|uniref:Acyl-CoA N-acyltransferase n=1 Tax=Rhizodiscina lignyota TaxID=1504668 RepID=A0A9P4MDI9_9PEZI|nr:acyl-CoA N-acyltransferase [Rhizodiscina lignyota]
MAANVRDAVTLRPAMTADMAPIAKFHAWYVENTVITFRKDAVEPSELLEGYQKILDQQLPYIVAVPAQGTVEEQEPIGFCYASGFRSVKAGYFQTAELSLFCHPEHRGRGIGTMLLQRMLAILKEPEKFPEYAGPKGPRTKEERVRQFIACMSVDVDAKKKGLALKEYYESFGFEQRGHLREVGFKFGRWIDTIYLQLTLW